MGRAANRKWARRNAEAERFFGQTRKPATTSWLLKAIIRFGNFAGRKQFKWTLQTAALINQFGGPA